VNDQLHAPTAVIPGKNLGTHWIPSLVGPRAGRGILEKRKVSNLPGFKSYIIQPITQSLH